MKESKQHQKVESHESTMMTVTAIQRSPYTNGTVTITKSYPSVSITQTNGRSINSSSSSSSSRSPSSLRSSSVRSSHAKSLCSGTFIPVEDEYNKSFHHRSNTSTTTDNNNNNINHKHSICCGVFRTSNEPSNNNTKILLQDDQSIDYIDCELFSKRTISLDLTATTISSSDSELEDIAENSSEDNDEDISIHPIVPISYTPLLLPPQRMPLSTTIYIRANDLPIHTNNNNNTNNINNSQYNPTPNSTLSPSPSDLFIALNNITSSHNHTTPPSPIAHTAVEQLYQRGIDLISNPNLWIAERKTDRMLKGSINTPGEEGVHTMNVPTSPLSFSSLLHGGGSNGMRMDVVLQWSAFIGSSHNCVRSEAVINTSAEWLYDLLLDSSRVKEYNKLSLGREDLWIMETTRPQRHGDDDDGDEFTSRGETTTTNKNYVSKVIRGENKPPMMKPVAFHSFMHGRELEGGAGYAIVTRTARLVDETTDTDNGCSSPSSQPSLPSELMTGCMLIIRMEGCDNQCVLINASQFTAPLPAMMTKKIGLNGMVTMISDLRKLGGGGEGLL